MEDVEDKLDQDYIFYLGFIQPYLKRIREKDTLIQCERWLQKLCGEEYKGVDTKRCRNIYLAQLLMCMQNGTLTAEFLLPVAEVDIMKAEDVFNLGYTEEELPDWLNDSEVVPKKRDENDKGRTYLATKALPDGQGAFAYVAVSLGDDEPMWMGGGEGHVEQNESPEHEIEKLLSKRRDATQREKVITFYNVLLENISDELDEKVPPAKNQTVNGLVHQLEQDLRDRDEFGKLEALSPEKQRVELLLILHERIKYRVDKVIKREEMLDEIEKTILEKAVLESSITEADRFKLPAEMWEQCMNKAPSTKNMDKLKDNYPMSLIEKFLELLSNYKEDIAMRMQRRHENILAQMKKEVRKEDEKGRQLVAEAQNACEFVLDALKIVRDRHRQIKDIEDMIRTQVEEGGKSEHEKLFEEMKAALVETQKFVEEESIRGRVLAEQVNVSTDQAEAANKLAEDRIRKMEDANRSLARNIRRITAAVEQFETRIQQVEMVKKSGAAHDL